MFLTTHRCATILYPRSFCQNEQENEGIENLVSLSFSLNHVYQFWTMWISCTLIFTFDLAVNKAFSVVTALPTVFIAMIAPRLNTPIATTTYYHAYSGHQARFSFVSSSLVSTVRLAGEYCSELMTSRELIHYS